MDMYSGIDFQSEFRNYAIKHLGVSGSQFYAWEKLQNSVYNNVVVPMNYQTPYVIEERQMNVTQMDIYSRMMMDRILMLVGPVNDQMSNIVSSQLLFLANLEENTDITMYVNGPGGSVNSGLTIIDAMESIAPDIRTVNTGMAASMTAVLLGSGTKGKRSALRHSRVMIHQVSSGFSGNIQDNEILMAQSRKYNDELFELLGEYTNKDPKQIKLDASRDLWLSANDALEYGLIDHIVTSLK